MTLSPEVALEAADLGGIRLSALIVGLALLPLVFEVVPRIWSLDDKPVPTAVAVALIAGFSYLGSHGSTTIQLSATGVGMFLALAVFELFRPTLWRRVKLAAKSRRPRARTGRRRCRRPSPFR